MAKKKTVFLCQNCGQEHSQWAGQCKNCGMWNTIVEEVIEKGNVSFSGEKKSNKTEAIPLNIVELSQEDRILLPNEEFNRVLGDGMVLGAVHLLGGEPGIGKSTLMLQMALMLKNKTVLYISGEESARQIKMRAKRLQNIIPENCFIYTETYMPYIFEQIRKIQPQFIIIDSIQTLYSENIDAAPGSISQIRQTSSELIQYAKQYNVPIVLIGHINKEGNIAGPKILEHMVDVVLQFEGDRNHIYRLLRGQKNRYGPTSELGIFEMRHDGLAEVKNPSFIIQNSQIEKLSGNAVSVVVEGIRPMMVEVQALVSSAVYGTPQRAATGFDTRRLNMLLAVLEKRAGFPLASKDVFLNITGGIRVEDPAGDLAVVSAILSSAIDIPIDRKTCFAAEVGLSGELRPVFRIDQRITEAKKLGYKTIAIAGENIVENNAGIKIVSLSKIEDLRDFLFA